GAQISERRQVFQTEWLLELPSEQRRMPVTPPHGIGRRLRQLDVRVGELEPMHAAVRRQSAAYPARKITLHTNGEKGQWRHHGREPRAIDGERRGVAVPGVAHGDVAA